MGETDKAKRPGVNVAAVVGLLVIVVLAGVGVFFVLHTAKPKPVPIGTVQGDLRTYDGQVVTVEGRVTETVNLLGFKTYQLKDDTGEIMVVTERGLPNKGDDVTVTGIVNQMFDIGGVNMTVIQEPRPEDQPKAQPK
jgi:hypothetical protein